MRCSSRTVYKSFYSVLERKEKQHKYPLPESIGIDEHSIKKPKYKSVEYVTMMVDHSNKRIYDLFMGRDADSVNSAFKGLLGKENVKSVSIDMSPTYRSVVRRHFPKATVVADRFHVHRLFTKLVNKFRKEITGDDRKNPIRTLVLRNHKDLKSYEKRAVLRFLNLYPKLREMYEYKEAVNRLYRTKGAKRARKAFIKLLDRMGKSKIERVLKLRATLVNWREEILNYFKCKITNGRVEGFNRRAKLLQRKAYGYSNFENYRMRLLNETARKASRR